MAGDQDTEVVAKLPNKFHEKIHMLEKPDLINIILGIIDDSDALGADNDRMESELNDLHAECVELSKRLAEKEKELAFAKETTLLTKDCEGCKGKASSKASTKAPISGSIASESLTKTNNLLQKAINDIATVATLIEKRSVNQTVFVKSRGLRYESD